MSNEQTVCVIMTAHNRRDLTVAAVRAVLRECGAQFSVSVVVVDDGSTDGTFEAVAAVDPERVVVARESGGRFWAAGMAIAEGIALRRMPDYLLWLNDDVDLDLGFLSVLLDASRRHLDSVVVGATRDPVTGETTYSGLRRQGAHPLSFELVQPQRHEAIVDAFNGNVVLVPIAVSQLVGRIDGGYAHAYADIAYGLELRRIGRPAILATQTIGSCPRNPAEGTWVDPTIPVLQRIRLLRSRKGSPLSSSARFLRRHGGPVWPLFLCTPYLRIGRDLVMRLRVWERP